MTVGEYNECCAYEKLPTVLLIFQIRLCLLGLLMAQSLDCP